MNGDRVLVSTAEDYFDLAMEELTTALGRSVDVERLGPDVGAVSLSGVRVREIAHACASYPVMFVKHLTVEAARLSTAARPDIQVVAKTAADAAGACAHLAVQTWVSGHGEAGFGSADAFAAIAEELTRRGVTVTRAGQPDVLSCCLTPSAIVVAVNRLEDSLSDWPGGRIRLARSADQVSRAEFKLEEVLRTMPIAVPDRGVAVDFGAAVGGWTRILRTRGLDVIAVDPADLDPRVAADPGVRHLRTTAGEYLRSRPDRVDLIVNDMRMDPLLSSELMVDAASSLRRGGLCVLTLKVGSRRVLATARECLRLLERAYSVVAARQLHHNRHEVTVALRRR